MKPNYVPDVECVEHSLRYVLKLVCVILIYIVYSDKMKHNGTP